jgi:hypothetical protein
VVADCPAVMAAAAGDADTVKSGTTTVIVTGLEELGWLFASPA